MENIELLEGDVQSGLLDLLAAEPAASLDSFLEQWPRTNPLVRATFPAAVDGTVLWPEAKTAGEEGRGLFRRFSEHVGRGA